MPSNTISPSQSAIAEPSWWPSYVADGGGDLIATENASGPCSTCYFGTDHLGSVRIVMDQNGGVVARHDYLPFGEELPGGMAGRTTPGFGAADLTTQRFTGQVRDSESGQDFFNARYFMAPLGRFNSADPMNAGASLGSSQSWNGYAYVLGNPLGLTDPSGMQWRTASTQVCTAVVSTSIDYSPTDDSFVNNAGTTSECHYTSYWVWVPDPVDTVGSGGGSVGGGGGTAPAKSGPPNTPIDWHKIGSCLVSSTLNHYGLTAAAGASGLLAIPISKALVPPYRVIGTPTTNLLSVLGHYAEITVPRMLESTNLLRIAGRANPYVAGALLAIDVGMISYDTYQCYQQATPIAPSAPAPQPATGPGGPG